MVTVLRFEVRLYPDRGIMRFIRSPMHHIFPGPAKWLRGLGSSKRRRGYQPRATTAELPRNELWWECRGSNPVLLIKSQVHRRQCFSPVVAPADLETASKP